MLYLPSDGLTLVSNHLVHRRVRVTSLIKTYALPLSQATITQINNNAGYRKRIARPQVR